MKTIFAVDDNDVNLATVKKALEDQYRVLTMPSALKMFSLLEKIIPDLILLDIEMPEMDGFEALKILKSNYQYKNIPVMFLTGYLDYTFEAQSFEMGVVDFIVKPFYTPILLKRIKTHLDIDELIRERITQIKQMQNGIVTVLADVVEERDKETSGHNNRISMYVKVLIRAMEDREVYVKEIRKWDIEIVSLTARLHDMGKICTLDTILNKPGILDNDEYKQIKFHTTDGARIIDRMIMQTGEEEFLHNAKLFAEYHHERWDGTGYPYGMKGEEIPLQGRIMAVIDVYDALVSKRSYKEAVTTEEAAKVISEGSGKNFDPKIVEVFLDIQEQFKAVKDSL
jgi:putative two-component system response regulator